MRSLTKLDWIWGSMFARNALWALLLTAAFLLYLQVAKTLSTSTVDTVARLPAPRIHVEDSDVNLADVTPDDVTAACARRVDWETVHVTIMSDRGYFVGVMALVNSIVHNTRSPVMFHFVTLAKDEGRMRQWIQGSVLRNISYEIITISAEKFAGQKRRAKSHLTNPLNLARVLLTDLLPCLGRVVFLDADCLVLGDIRELYLTEIQPNHVTAFLNMCDEKEFNTTSRLAENLFNYSNEHVQRASIPKQACMLNAGVFVADLAKWEQQKVSQQLQFWMELRLREAVFQKGIPGSGSQIILFTVLFDKFTPLSPQWNFMDMSSKTVPKILHWHGRTPKPWNRPKEYSPVWNKYYVPFPGS